MALEQEFAYYKQHQRDLVAEHDHEFVVIKGDEVLGFFPSYEAAYVEAAKTQEAGTFLIQQVLPGESAYTQTFHSRVA